MKREYFIGIVPPKEYSERIIQFQRKWINNLNIEPHITIKAQGGLTTDKKWIEKVQKVCQSFAPFQLSLNKPRYFEDNVLYLSVHSDRINTLHEKLVHEISPSKHLIKQYFEFNEFVPHLTLALMQSKEELKHMEKLAEIELTPYPTFNVTFIRIYQLNVEKQRYENFLDISLN
jgi:2'-5' RNA ligase